MLNVGCDNAEFHNAECHCALCHYAECHSAERIHISVVMLNDVNIGSLC
jgi:hypothetical protein